MLRDDGLLHAGEITSVHACGQLCCVRFDAPARVEEVQAARLGVETTASARGLRFAVGDRVAAVWDTLPLGTPFRGVVSALSADGMIEVTYDDTEVRTEDPAALVIKPEPLFDATRRRLHRMPDVGSGEGPEPAVVVESLGTLPGQARGRCGAAGERTGSWTMPLIP